MTPFSSAPHLTLVSAFGLQACVVGGSSVEPEIFSAAGASNTEASKVEASNVGAGRVVSSGATSESVPLDRVDLAPSGSDSSGSDSSGSDSSGSDSSGSDSSGSDSSADDCDMTGRWLLTEHGVIESLGQRQITFRWIYYEIEQDGDAFGVTKGLLCGDEGVGVGVFVTLADFAAAWDSAMERTVLEGRTGTSLVTAGGCAVHFDRFYTVRGATVPFYLDPSMTLPTAQEPAADGVPGWEDWDGDGNPGITGNVSGVVNGRVFLTPRQWSELEGTVPDLSSPLELRMLWDQEANLVGIDGTGLLTSQAARAADPALHFAELARLAPGEATGDDAAICSAIRELAPSLTPKAATPQALNAGP